jgi:hypothetical protein
MSNDRNAGGLEDPVQRVDRLLFCRSFHSKLSPVGGLVRTKAQSQDRRVATIVNRDLTRDTSSLDTPGHDDISEACPLTLARLAAHPNEVSRFEPKPAGPPDAGTQNPVFTRLCRPCN